MHTRMNIRMPNDIVEKLEVEAKNLHTSIASIIRERVARTFTVKGEDPPSQPLPTSNQSDASLLECLTITTEILLLLREFLFERNAQILKKVDEKMDQHFGKNRKKVL